MKRSSCDRFAMKTKKKEILRNGLSSLGTGHDSSVPGNLQLRLGPQEP